MRKIGEIFHSLQGEGFYTGTPAVFVHFFGRNLRCGFCGTRHEEGVMMTDGEIAEKVSSFPVRMVILTGGEPSLWIDKAFISRLRGVGKQVRIETNSTRSSPDGTDWVTCSPKENAPMVLKGVGGVKVVYTGQNSSTYTETPARYHFLQSCSCQNMKEVVDYILRHPRWRLGPQTHKLIDIQ